MLFVSITDPHEVCTNKQQTPKLFARKTNEFEEEEGGEVSNRVAAAGKLLRRLPSGTGSTRRTIEPGAFIPSTVHATLRLPNQVQQRKNLTSMSKVSQLTALFSL